MPKIDKGELVKFGSEPKEQYTQYWPKGSKFLKLVTLPEGIYTVFLVPSVLAVDSAGNIESEPFTFMIAVEGRDPSPEDEFLDVVTVYTEMTPESLREKGLPSDYQAVILFPIFLKK